MKKRFLSSMSMVLAAIILAAALSACSGGTKISDGVYYLEDGQLEITENTAVYTASIEFLGNEVTLINKYPGLGFDDKAITSKYTLKKGYMTYETESGEMTVSLTVVDENTIKYGVIKYVKQ